MAHVIKSGLAAVLPVPAQSGWQLHLDSLPTIQPSPTEAAGRRLNHAKMALNQQFLSAEALVRQFVSVATELCLQLRAGLAIETSVDPLQLILAGCWTGRIPQRGEINGVRYCRHGFGAWLRDAKVSTQKPGIVDIDVKFGELDRPDPWIFHAGCIRLFAGSLNHPEPPELDVERACIALVRTRVLRGTIVPSKDQQSPWSDGHWSFDPGFGAFGPQGEDIKARRKAMRQAIERLGPPLHRTSFKWDEVGIVDDPLDW